MTIPTAGASRRARPRRGRRAVIAIQNTNTASAITSAGPIRHSSQGSPMLGHLNRGIAERAIVVAVKVNGVFAAAVSDWHAPLGGAPLHEIASEPLPDDVTSSW